MENMNLYYVEVKRGGILTKRYVVAENEKQVIEDYPKSIHSEIEPELIVRNIDIIYEF